MTKVEDVTGFPELLDGRVKTLHPRIHAGILARSDREEDLAALAEHGIEPFDLVCVNLYPVRARRRPPRARRGRSHRDDRRRRAGAAARGGEELRVGHRRRASAGLRRRCSTSCGRGAERRRPSSGGGSPRSRSRRSAAYEAAIARWFQRDSGFPETFVPSFDRVRELPYGENPHQRAAYYAERGARTHLLGFVEQHQGKELSFNNLGDLSAARLLAAELDRPACVIVKHANPCGVAVADTIEEAYAKALAADPVSAYGGVVVVNRAGDGGARRGAGDAVRRGPVRAGVRRRRADRLAGKPALRVLEHTDQRAPRRGRARLSPGHRRSPRPGSRSRADRAGRACEVVCGEVSDEQWDDLLFAWRVVKHVTSNAIVLARRRPDARDRRGADEPRRRGADRDREGARARPLARRRRARVGRLLPVRGRAAARARRRDRRLHPARRLEARREARCQSQALSSDSSGRGDGLHADQAPLQRS